MYATNTGHGTQKTKTAYIDSFSIFSTFSVAQLSAHIESRDEIN